MFSAATWLGGRGQRFESRVGVWLGSEQVTPTKAGFNPDGPNASKLLGYTLDQSEFMFGVDVTVAKFKFSAKLVLSDSPYPTGLEFPYSIPTEFYGFRERGLKPLERVEFYRGRRYFRGWRSSPARIRFALKRKRR